MTVLHADDATREAITLAGPHASRYLLPGMRRLRLLVGLLLFSAAAIPEGAAVACMLMRSDMRMTADCGHDLVVTSADTPGDCPVTECLPRTTALIPDLTRTVDLPDVGRAPEPQRYLRQLSWGIRPALPPPKPLLSSN